MDEEANNHRYRKLTKENRCYVTELLYGFVWGFYQSLFRPLK